MMKVEVLYVPDCPFRRAAVKLVKDVLASQGVTADVREILVRDETMAAALGFFGSPSIHINGGDIAGEPPDAKRFALSCRLYPESQVIGLPPAELVRRAVVSAREGARK